MPEYYIVPVHKNSYIFFGRYLVFYLATPSLTDSPARNFLIMLDKQVRTSKEDVTKTAQ